MRLCTPLLRGSVGLSSWTLVGIHVHYPLKPHGCLSGRLVCFCFFLEDESPGVFDEIRVFCVSFDLHCYDAYSG